MRDRFTRLLGLAGAVLITMAWAVRAQDQPLRFEVSSVKPAASSESQGNGMRATGVGVRSPVTFRAVRASLQDLVMQAYGVKKYQISGPEWLQSERFDVDAKLPDGATTEQVPLMLQALLADRFRLTLHREPRPMPVYALVVAKGGPKLLETSAPPPPGWPARMGPGMVSGNIGPGGLSSMTGRMTTEQVARGLTFALDRPVLDLTGLKDTYYINIEWTPDERSDPKPGMARAPDTGAMAAASEPGPSVFSVLEHSLGLRLEPRKEPMEVLVIDHAERTPTEN